MTGSKLLRSAAVVAALFLSARAHGTTITIVNGDAPGLGFNDPSPRTPVGGNTGTTLGEQRLKVFEYAAAFWAERLDSPVEIRVRAKFEALTPCTTTSAVLGSAGTTQVWSDFRGAPRAETWFPVALANKLAGEDLDPDDEDVRATFTSSLDDGSCAYPKKWYYGLDAQPTSGTTDFATVIIHELGHGLGFQTFVDRETGQKFPYGDPQAMDDAYMVHLYDGTTGKTWDQMTDGERLASSTNTGNLLWNGPIVIAAASGVLIQGIGAGGRPLMYAPSLSEAGSSISHWDTSLSPNEMMEPYYTSAMHRLDITDELMLDLGWGLASGSAEYHWILPSSAKAPGKGGAYYTTALSIGNRGAAEARYRMKFLGHDADGTGGAESSEFVLGPNQSVTYEDVLGSVFSLANGNYGAIRITANVPSLNVLGQTATPVLTDWKSCVSSGFFGQSVPAVPASGLITAGTTRSIVGIRDDAAFRTNLILANAGTSIVTVDLTLLSASGAILGTRSVSLHPLGMTQVGPLVGGMGVSGAVRDAQLLLTTSTTGGAFAAYASVIDNVTNDPRTLLPN